MNFKLGNLDTKLYMGSSEVKCIYLGNNKVYESESEVVGIDVEIQNGRMYDNNYIFELYDEKYVTLENVNNLTINNLNGNGYYIRDFNYDKAPTGNIELGDGALVKNLIINSAEGLTIGVTGNLTINGCSNSDIAVKTDNEIEARLSSGDGLLICIQCNNSYIDISGIQNSGIYILGNNNEIHISLDDNSGNEFFINGVNNNIYCFDYEMSNTGVTLYLYGNGEEDNYIEGYYIPEVWE